MADTDTTALKKYQRTPGAKGGPRPGAGRKPGAPNKATATLKELAREYTPQALEALVKVMIHGESEAARVAAANAVLDRGYGKPSTVLAGDEEGGPVKHVVKITLEAVEPK